ncbi:hypothetical protein A2U01_0063993 [Trifolium medium]|uniref:Uncharacterized protein n=1 Tax=Trifolium medium TaxID=97028 RepID=A0A392S4E8_9FABA|nr:hypothetical protein [Trifolium medium]
MAHVGLLASQHPLAPYPVAPQAQVVVVVDQHGPLPPTLA